MSRRGPTASGYQPSRDKYKCPVKNCNSEIRGDDISKHFQKNANLVALDKSTENQTVLIQRLDSEDVIEQSNEYLSNLLKQDSNSVKLHSLYLLQHGVLSAKLPNHNSINFKCQHFEYTIEKLIEM